MPRRRHAPSARPAAPASAPPAVGDWVEIDGMSGVGRVIALEPRRKSARVLVGDQEWTLPLTRLRRTAEGPAEIPATYLVRVVGGGGIAHSIDLHGMSVEEALAAVDRGLDQAVVGHLNRFRIIHGHGTGALRNAVRRMLTSHPHVESFRFGDPHEGGLACTVAELRPYRR